MRHPPKNFNDPYTLYRALAGGESAAIVHLHRKVSHLLQSWRRGRNVPAADLEEMAEDTVIITLSKIETGSFQFEGTDPCAYANVIAQNLMHNFMRRKQWITTEIQEWDAAEEPWIEQYLNTKELQRLIAGALEKMPANCRQLITLFHLEGKTDEETLNQGLTPYTTVQSLRSKRGECMKKLRLLMEGFKKHLTP